jgi:hypothetical protein
MNISSILTEHIINNIPISFSKYGDGEYYCAFERNGKNCDNDTYTHKLGQGLICSFKYMVENADNSYIGMWHDEKNKYTWEKIVQKKVNWVDYHSIIIDKQYANDKLTLYKSIKNSNRKKIIVCNELLIKSKLLFNADEIVLVPFNNWFDTTFDDILTIVSNLIRNDNEHMVITCCGMSAKVLICELYKRFPRGIYLDFGSAIDLICTKRDSRGREYNYEYISNFLNELLPEEWNNYEYNYIYEKANKKLGTHL